MKNSEQAILTIIAILWIVAAIKVIDKDKVQDTTKANERHPVFVSLHSIWQ